MATVRHRFDLENQHSNDQTILGNFPKKALDLFTLCQPSSKSSYFHEILLL